MCVFYIFFLIILNSVLVGLLAVLIPSAGSCSRRLVSCVCCRTVSCARCYLEHCVQALSSPEFTFLPGARGHEHSLCRGRCRQHDCDPPRHQQGQRVVRDPRRGKPASFRTSAAGISPHCLLLVGAVCSGPRVPPVTASPAPIALLPCLPCAAPTGEQVTAPSSLSLCSPALLQHLSPFLMCQDFR